MDRDRERILQEREEESAAIDGGVREAGGGGAGRGGRVSEQIGEREDWSSVPYSPYGDLKGLND